MTTMETKVRATALAMILIGVYGMGVTVLGLVLRMVMRPPTAEEVRALHLPQFAERIFLSEAGGPTVGDGVWALVSVVAMAFVIFAGIRVYQQRQWPVAFAGAIVLLIPCVAPCCLSCGLSVAVGVWALIFLLDAQVKASFKP